MQKCFRYLKGKCEKGKDCGFTHSKADPSKGDPEVPRRMAEKKARESSGRDAAAGVVLGGDRPKVLLAIVEEPADAETEEWIWDTGAPLMSERGFLRTSDFECRWRRKLSRVCCGRNG